ncbi:MAG: hypothetical protein ACI8PZ_006124 [Myxococcota bacterium]|jgi:hypothetical protein
MIRFAAVIALTLPAVAFAGGPLLDISGACPGVMSITGSGYTPGGNVAVLKGSGMGSDAMPAGPCIGGRTGLSGLGYVTMVRADGGGNISVSPSIGGPLCGSYVQFVDTASCGLSNVDTLGDVGGLVGSFDVDAGPEWDASPPTYTCQEACALNFGGVAGDYACSIFSDSITGTGWMSEYGSAAYCAGGIDLPHDTKVCDVYDAAGCQSAYIRDNCGGGESINYCFAM